MDGTTNESNYEYSCSFGNRKGVWYSLIGTGHIITVTTCFQETNFESVVEVRTVCSRTSSCVSNDATGVEISPCPFTNGNYFTFESTLDQEYKIMVFGSGYYTTGDFRIAAMEYTPPDNDLCTNSISLDVNGPMVHGSTVNSTKDASCRSGSPNERGVWYSLQGNGNVMAVSTCHEETNFNSEVRVMQTCGGSCYSDSYPSVELEPCHNMNGSRKVFDSKPDVEYKILVSAASGYVVGDFAITATDYQAPRNDLCINALPLPLNDPSLLVGSTINATRDDSCGGGYNNNRGVWYTLEGTGRTINIHTCFAETDYDSGLFVREGCEGNCVPNDVYGSACSSGTDATNYKGRNFTFDSEPGKAYYVLVGSDAYSEEIGTFRLSAMDYVAPPNDFCANAIPLEVNGPTLAGTTINATKDHRCGATKEKQERGVWYSFVGNGRIMTVTTCHDATDFYSELYVSGGCQQGCYADQSAKSGYCQNTDDDSTDEFYTKGRNFTFDSEDGKEYRVLVSGDSLSTTGHFAIDLVDYIAPPNDACQAALPLIVNGPVVVGSTVNATRDSRCGTHDMGDTRGVWYTFTGTGKPTTVSTCHSVTNFASRIRVSEVCGGGCLTNDERGIRLLSCDNRDSDRVTFDAMAGKEYYVLVHGSGRGDWGTFGISVVDYNQCSSSRSLQECYPPICPCQENDRC